LNTYARRRERCTFFSKVRPERSFVSAPSRTSSRCDATSSSRFSVSRATAIARCRRSASPTRELSPSITALILPIVSSSSSSAVPSRSTVDCCSMPCSSSVYRGRRCTVFTSSACSVSPFARGCSSSTRTAALNAARDARSLASRVGTVAKAVTCGV